MDAYEKNPDSRVFAPLAETYRKLGMVEDALSILKKGLKHHPRYITALTTLGQCYLDQGRLDLAYQTLFPLVEENRENVLMQKLFAKICDEKGFLEEALETYKYLLYLNPKDSKIAEKVYELEKEFEEDRGESIDCVEAIGSENEDLWRQVDFGSADAVTKESLEELDEVIQQSLQASQSELGPETSSAKVVSMGQPETKAEDPIISHTLVDLYCEQKQYDMAKDILEKIIMLNPKDKRSVKKLKEIELLMPDTSEGRVNLMNLYDSTISRERQVSKAKRLSSKLALFLDRVKERGQVQRVKNT